MVSLKDMRVHTRGDLRFGLHFWITSQALTKKVDKARPNSENLYLFVHFPSH